MKNNLLNLAVISALATASSPLVLTARQLIAGKGAEFATIQAALDEAQPGDTVVIKGGVYTEHISSVRAGEPGKPITIRAATNQEVLLRAGSPLEGEALPVAEFPGIFARDVGPMGYKLEDDSIGIWEVATHLRLKRVFTLEECAERLASWFYGDGKVYIHSSGLADANLLPYYWEDVENPVVFITHSHMVVDGLQATLGKHGIEIHGTRYQRANHVTIRNCRAYCNRSGGIHASGDNHLIENNETFHNNQYGIQLRHGLNFTVVRGNRSLFNGPNNGQETDSSVPADLSFYSRGLYNRFEDNVLIGTHQNTFRIKTAGNNSQLVRNNVIKGYFDCSAPAIENNTIIANGLGPRFGGYVDRVVPDSNPDPERTDPGGNQRLTNLIYPAIDKEDPSFADPTYHDYRLQSDSPYRSKGADSNLSNILYVDSRNGNDSANGRSIDAAFKTLPRALKSTHPGYTLYLLPGDYADPVRMIMGAINPDEPIRIRAYGKSGEAVISGEVKIEIANSDDIISPDYAYFDKIPPRHIVMEGLVFKGQGVRLSGAEDISFKNCVWDSSGTALLIEKSTNIHIDHATFTGKGLSVDIKESHQTTVARSLFDGKGTSIAIDDDSSPTLQSYYNSFTKANWQVGQKRLIKLEEWNQSIKLTTKNSIDKVKLSKSYALPLDSALVYGADDFGFVGAQGALAAARLEIRDLRIEGLAPDVATLRWETPNGYTLSHVLLRRLDTNEEREIIPVTTFQIWGQYFDMSFITQAYYIADRHAGLPGLEPKTSYEVILTATSPDGSISNSQKIKFKTPAKAPTPRNLYVSPQGSDKADGTSPQKAWKTLLHAGSHAAPGDTVHVLPGEYSETLRARISGSESHPILFTSAEPRKAVINLQKRLPSAFDAFNVDYIQFDGFAISNGAFSVGRTATIASSRGIKYTNNHNRYPDRSSFDKLKLGQGGLLANNSPGLLVENNVFLCGGVAVGLGKCPGTRILGNTILGEGNYGIAVVPDSPDEEYHIENNLFYKPVMGYKTGSAIWYFNVVAKFHSDHNLYYIPENYKGTIGMFISNRYRELDEWQAVSGLDAHSVVAEPTFVDPANHDFRLTPDSVGINSASDGGPIGIR